LAGECQDQSLDREGHVGGVVVVFGVLFPFFELEAKGMIDSE